MTAVRPYRSGDRDRVLEIIERVWGASGRRDHAFLWDWKHRFDEAAAEDEGRGAHVVEQNDALAGYCGAIPLRFRIGARTIDGAFCLDTFTDPATRGAGIRLMKRQLETSRLLVGAANVRAQDLWQRLSGRSLVIRDARKMACLLDPAPILAGRGVPSPLRRLARGANGLARRLLLRDAEDTGGGRLRLQEVESFPPEVDPLLEAFQGRYANLLLRDRAYLEWRYVTCPIPYRRVLLRDADRLLGYAVYRPALLNGRLVVLLLEFVTGEPDAACHDALLRHVERQAIALGACEIETLDSGCPILRRALWRRGYFRKSERLTILSYAPGDLADDVYHPERWYLALGDGDFEFIFFKQGVGSLVERPAPRRQAS